MQDLPRPGIQLVSPALAGEFFTIEPPRKSCSYHSYRNVLIRENKSLQINELTRGEKEKAMAPHSRTLAWRIPGTEEPGRLQSMDGVTKSWTRLYFHFHFSLSCNGEGNGNPLQCSCLENPRDGGPWWAAIYGVAQSRPRLKWLSSSRGEKSPSKEICQLGLKKTTPTKENANGEKNTMVIFIFIFLWQSTEPWSYLQHNLSGDLWKTSHRWEGKTVCLLETTSSYTHMPFANYET